MMLKRKREKYFPQDVDSFMMLIKNGGTHFFELTESVHIIQ